MEYSIAVRGAVALLGSFPALSGADFQVSPGEVVAIRGPNGAGKTSLLRACAGLLPVISGEIVVLGYDLREDQRAVRRRVSLLGHATHLYDDLSAEENVRFHLAATGMRRSELKYVAGRALDRCGLGGRLTTLRVSSLSAGQRRRVALAVHLARSADVWLLDEPHAGLDADARDVLDAEIMAAAAAGASVVIVSHEHDHIERLVGRSVTMAGGRVVESTPITTKGVFRVA